MAELPDETSTERIKIIYSRLETQWHSMEGCSESNTTTEGPLSQYKTTLAELKELTGNDFDSFMPHAWTNEEQFIVCYTRDLRTQISGLMGEIRPVYLPGQVPHFVKETQSLALSINQHVNQEVNVTQQLVIDVALKLEKLEESYASGSKERNFLSKLKSGLSTVKDFATLTSLIIETAKSTNLSFSQLHSVLRALHLA